MYLSPALAGPTSMSPPFAAALAATLRRIEQADDTTAVSADLAARFPPPSQPDPANELGAALPDRGGRGLFGNSEVWVTERPSTTATALLRERAEPVPVSALWPAVEPS